MSEIAEHVPGYDNDFVVSFQDVLSGKVTVSGSAVVIGGDRTGIETARYLAARGVLVTILERLPEIAKNAVGDACTGSNPRAIDPDQMSALLKCCFYDTEVDF